MGETAALYYLTAASAAYTVVSSQQAADDVEAGARAAEALAHDNARLTEIEGEREQELARAAADDVEATARAKQAASGFASGETSDLVLSDIKKKHAESLAWMAKSTKSRADITRAGGAYSRQTGYAQASSTRAAGIGSAAGQVISTGNANDWWQ